MTNALHIPYERSKGVSNSGRLSSLQFFVDNREYQMRYTRVARTSGVYRRWIDQLTDDELYRFIEQNKAKIEKGLDFSTYGPKFRREYFWRSALYQLELLYRQNGPNVSVELFERWKEEVQADLAYWEGKAAVAQNQWEQSKAIQPFTSAPSSVTAYY